MTHEDIDIYAVLLHGVFAAVGGMVRVLRGNRRAYTLTEFMAGALVGTFAGMTVYFVCRHLGLGEYLTVALTGLGGYSGTPLLDAGAIALRRLLARELNGNGPEAGQHTGGAGVIR